MQPSFESFCVCASGWVHFHTMALAKQFGLRFRAASLFLTSCGVGERAAKSGEQAAALRTLLSEGQGMQQSEHDELRELVLSVDRGWESSDRLSLLEALSTRVHNRRRKEQQWVTALLDIYTEEEWTRWKAFGSRGMNTTLDQMIARVKSFGGKNLCEYSKKLITATWLHLRGDGLHMSRNDRFS